MKFPLEKPGPDIIKALEKAWRRQDLSRYLTRWANAEIPAIPAAFYRYPFQACDLGCGIGKFIQQESERRRDWGFLGIDKGAIRAGKMTKRLQKTPRPNVFGLHTNAIPVLAAMPYASLDLLTIFYPNPWWPNKHRQKRWAFHPILPQLASLLKPGGQWIITSNEHFYLAEFLFAIANHPNIQKIACTFQGRIQAPMGRTHFETKFRQEGTACGELRFLKS